MKVGNSEQAQAFKDNEDLLKRMNKSIEKKIAVKEQEINQVNTLYDKKVDQAKLAGEEDLVSSLDRNQQRIVSESNQFEEKIKGYQDRLKKARETVDLEETTVRAGHKTKIEQMKTQNEENFQDQYANTTESTREIQNATQDSVQEIAAKSRTERSLMESNANYQINALSTELNAKGANIERDFREKLDHDVRAHNVEVSRQRDELKKLMLVDADKNKRLSAEKTRVNNEQLSFQDKYQQEMLKQRDADFKIRYENIVKEHDAVLKDISTRLAADVKKMVESTSAEKKIIEGRVADPFYRVDTLNPKMAEELKTVTVSLPVAEHEKENVHLSTQGRSIKITLSRKFTDNMTAQDGSLNRSTRSELFSKELKTVDILSPKDIVQSYADGVLTFKINKA